MRFHIGFSKRISVKKLIEILGFIFVMLLVFFGVYDTTHALTKINKIGFNNYERIDYLGNNIQDTVTITNGIVEKNDTSYGYNIRAQYFSYDGTNYGYFIGASTDSFTGYRYSQQLSFELSNNNYCVNDTSNLESINIYFYTSFVDFGTLNSWNTFHVNNYDDLANIRIRSYDSVSDSSYITTCSKELVNNNNYGYYFVSCEGVFNGNNRYPVDFYYIEYLNAIPFNNRFLHSDDIEFVNTSFIIGRQAIYKEGYTDTIMYECSNDKPVLDGYFNADNDPGGFNDIYNVIKDNYDTELPGINTSITLLNLPKTFTDLLLLPFNVVQAVINNSNSCHPYEIDFSSIMIKWGNPEDTYSLSLPCMREVLPNLLGNWYNIIDMLICFFLFYDITMHVIALLNAITYGDDLFGYFFQKSGNNKGSDKIVVDSRTGEVLNG